MKKLSLKKLIHIESSVSVYNIDEGIQIILCNNMPSCPSGNRGREQKE